MVHARVEGRAAECVARGEPARRREGSSPIYTQGLFLQKVKILVGRPNWPMAEKNGERNEKVFKLFSFLCKKSRGSDPR